MEDIAAAVGAGTVEAYHNAVVGLGKIGRRVGAARTADTALVGDHCASEYHSSAAVGWGERVQVVLRFCFDVEVSVQVD